MMSRGRILLVALAVGGAAIYATLPSRPQPLGPAAAGFEPAVRGAIHIHTNRSDGTGTPEEIAAAAARAGLQFIILTDHSDASSEPTAPAYRDGVLAIDAVEISTDGGHVVALGLPRAPYPLAGAPRAVLEDIARLGGMSIVAHPTSEKAALRWTEWEEPFDGLEWLNGDSEWRDESPAALARALLSYPFRHPETLAALLDRPDEIFRRWDALTRERQVVAVAAGDAHARLALRGGQEPYDDRLSLHLPGYEQVFRAFSVTATGVTLTGDAPADARAIVDAIRRGHVYSSIDGRAGPAALSFSATSARGRAVAGDTLPAGEAVTLEVNSNAPADATLTLVKDGVALATVPGGALRQDVPGDAAVYRVEIHLPAMPGTPPVPWVVSNPIYVRNAAPGTPQSTGRPAATAFALQEDTDAASGWRLESREDSLAALDGAGESKGRRVSLRWGLGGRLSQGPYAALVRPVGQALPDYDRMLFTARASQPTRISVQLRAAGNGDGERWHRSIYLDSTPRDVAIFFDEMTPRGVTSEPRPALAAVRDILFVVDTVNTKPGTNGQVWIEGLTWAR